MANLSRCNLAHANLCCANLERADLSGSVLDVRIIFGYKRIFSLLSILFFLIVFFYYHLISLYHVTTLLFMSISPFSFSVYWVFSKSKNYICLSLKFLLKHDKTEGSDGEMVGFVTGSLLLSRSVCVSVCVCVCVHMDMHMYM